MNIDAINRSLLLAWWPPGCCGAHRGDALPFEARMTSSNTFQLFSDLYLHHVCSLWHPLMMVVVIRDEETSNQASILHKRLSMRLMGFFQRAAARPSLFISRLYA